MGLKAMTTSHESTALKQWQKERKRALHSNNLDWLRCKDCRYGKGGAIYIDMLNVREDSSVTVFLQDLVISDNLAVVGGSVSCSWELLYVRKCRWVLCSQRPQGQKNSTQQMVSQAAPYTSFVLFSRVPERACLEQYSFCHRWRNLLEHTNRHAI